MNTTVIIFNTGFSVKYWNRYCLEDFLTESLKSNFFSQYPIEKRIELLKFAYAQICNE